MKDFDWTIKDHLRCCGYIHTPEGKCLRGESLAEHFAHAGSEQELRDLLRAANGCYAVVLKLGSCLFAAVDRIRSIPLFYPEKVLLSEEMGAETLISGHACDFDAGDIELDPEILAEYLITGYVTGADTLKTGVKQLQAGHYLNWKRGESPRQIPYYSYLHGTPAEEPLPELLARLDKVHLAVAHRLADSLAGRTAVIPLSGGYDSRLLAWLLKRIGYPGIICYSYGVPGNRESEISRQVAQVLGLRWVFTPHNRKLWYEGYQSQARKDYYDMACNAVSSAHIQDWLSVKIMKERRMIPADSVIIPGHSADFLEGSHLPESFFNSPEISKAQLYKEIFKRHYSLWKTKDLESQAVFGKRIDAVLAAPEMLSNTEAASLFDNWDYQERQAKFIVNSVRAYEFWGYDWRLPLWDHELMDFWAEVPLPYKHQRNLWHSYQALYLPVQIPVFSHFSYSIRIRDKVLRQVVGNINDIRYGRFTPYQNPCQYATVKVQSLMDPVLQYPGYIKPGKPLLKCDLNAIQALISLL